MADLENRVEKVEGRVSTLEITVEKLSQKVDDFIAESRRNADRQDARLQQLENRMDATNQRMDAINQRMDNALNQIHNMTIAISVGVGAVIVGVISLILK